MLKKTIKYTDCNGVEREENFYFNLSKAEVMKLEMSKKGGLAEHIQRVVEAQDAPTILEIFEELIDKSYGEKSADGREFLKEDRDGYKLYKRFKQTEAYSVLFMELATNADAAAKFVNGIVPADMGQENAANHPAIK